MWLVFVYSTFHGLFCDSQSSDIHHINCADLWAVARVCLSSKTFKNLNCGYYLVHFVNCTINIVQTYMHMCFARFSIFVICAE
jgi:hypothetical protein